MLFDLFVLLFAALLTVPAARRLGFVPALGFIVAGALIGPWGLALIRSADHIEVITRFGTVTLLFLVMLRVTPGRVAALVDSRSWIGMQQFVFTVGLVMMFALIIGLPWYHALITGLAFSLSSGTIAARIFDDHYPAGSPLTDVGRQVLLVHGLMLIPILVLVPAVGFEGYLDASHAWPQVLTGIVLIALVWRLGRPLLDQAFRHVVDLGLDEIFAAFAVLIVIGLLLIVQVFDLPLEIGAVLAGLLLARSEYGSAVDSALRPFRLLLIGVFFIVIGMSIDFTTFIRKPAETLALVALLVVIKIYVMRTLLRFSSVPRRQRVWLATVLSQSGELSFVVISYALDRSAIPVKLGDQLVLVIALSMLLTPVLLRIAARRDTVPAAHQSDTGIGDGEAADAQLVVAGFGRVGRVVAELLRSSGFRVSVIERNPERFRDLRAAGFIGFYGDALRPDLLEAAGVRRATVMVVAIDDPERTADLVRRLRRDHPHLMVIVRAIDDLDRTRLEAGGADRAYAETFETALLMGEDALELAGVGPLEAQTLAESFRDATTATRSGN